MKKIVSLTLAAVVATSALAEPALAQQRRLITIASGWVVGVYYPLAGAMSSIAYNTKTLNIRATVEASGASVANAQLIAAGDVDFALLQNDIAFYAFNGSTLAAFKGKPVKNMGGIFTIYPELIHIVATHASGVKSIRDLKGKRVVLGPQGSGTEQNALQTLGVYGIKESDLGKAEHLDAGAASEQLKARVRGRARPVRLGQGRDGADRSGSRRSAQAAVHLLHAREDSRQHVPRSGARGADAGGQGDAGRPKRPSRGSRL